VGLVDFLGAYFCFFCPDFGASHFLPPLVVGAFSFRFFMPCKAGQGAFFSGVRPIDF